MNSLNVANVVSIDNKNNVPNQKLGKLINILLSRLAKSTEKSYRSTFEDFFMFLFNKHYSECDLNDVRTIEYTDIINFIGHLEKKYGTGTVKTKLGSLQFLARELNKIELGIVNPNHFKINIKDKGDTSSFGALTEGEIYLLFDYVKTMKSKSAMQQYLFFKLCFATAHRSGNLLKCKWSDIRFIEEGDSTIPVLTIHDKTKTFKTALPQNLYDEMIDVLYNGNKDELIFTVSKMTLSRTLNKFCIANNIDKEGRNIVIHSIKKSSGDVAYSRSSGDIVSVANHLHHTNIQTCYKNYLHRNAQFKAQLSFTLLDDEDIDESIIDYITKDYTTEEVIERLLKLDVQTKRIILKALSPNGYTNNKDTNK